MKSAATMKISECDEGPSPWPRRCVSQFSAPGLMKERRDETRVSVGISTLNCPVRRHGSYRDGIGRADEGCGYSVITPKVEVMRPSFGPPRIDLGTFLGTHGSQSGHFGPKGSLFVRFRKSCGLREAR